MTQVSTSERCCTAGKKSGKHKAADTDDDEDSEAAAETEQPGFDPEPIET
jgi:hypothetical protein